MESLRIVAGCVLAAVVYGIVHDQVTARICLEYFTVFHAPIFDTQSPTLLAFGWGIVATWWMGGLLGVPLAIASRIGSWPKLRLNNLVRPISYLLAIMAACAVVSGISGYLWGHMPPLVADLIPASQHRRFLADWWAHNASYASGFFGGLALSFLTLGKRIRLGREAGNAPSPAPRPA